jgi:ribosomal protein L11 methyltransferase
MDAFDSKHLRMGTSGRWLELSVEAELEAIEAVSEVLARFGHQGGIVIEEAHRPAADGISIERDPTRPAWVRAYLPYDRFSAEAVQRVETALSLLGGLRPIGPLQTRTLSEEDWARAWKEHYSVLHVTERIVVVPAWKRFRPRSGQIALRLDPGMAFGTGIHPTTQLCLRALERFQRPGSLVLDLGTGSGILAIAAAKLGWWPVLAVDKDPVAVAAARANIRRNRLGARIALREGTLEPGMGPFDLILGNLLAPVLNELAGLLAQALHPAGTLIASGVLVEQMDEVTAAFAAAGLRTVEQPREGDWVALVARREEV